MRSNFIDTHFTHTRTNSFGWTEDGIMPGPGAWGIPARLNLPNQIARRRSHEQRLFDEAADAAATRRDHRSCCSFATPGALAGTGTRAEGRRECAGIADAPRSGNITGHHPQD